MKKQLESQVLPGGGTDAQDFATKFQTEMSVQLYETVCTAFALLDQDCAKTISFEQFQYFVSEIGKVVPQILEQQIQVPEGDGKNLSQIDFLTFFNQVIIR